MSGIVNKAKEAAEKIIHPERKNPVDTTTGNNPQSTNAGPHSSNMGTYFSLEVTLEVTRSQG
jgi:hypothetical protein